MPIEGVGSMFRPLFRALSIPASGLRAQRRRIETIAQNIANAETTRGADGEPYRRRVVQLEAEPTGWATGPGGAPGTAGAPAGVPETLVPRVGVPELPYVEGPTGPTYVAGGVRVAGVAEDGSPGPLVYDPGHPDADEAGYVRYPNVRITDEMIDLMDARRAYEANATVFEAVKSMLRRAIDI